jgi:hypothetical protein
MVQRSLEPVQQFLASLANVPQLFQSQMPAVTNLRVRCFRGSCQFVIFCFQVALDTLRLLSDKLTVVEQGTQQEDSLLLDLPTVFTTPLHSWADNSFEPPTHGRMAVPMMMAPAAMAVSAAPLPNAQEIFARTFTVLTQPLFTADNQQRFAALEVVPERLHFGDVIGVGEFGTVRQATLFSQTDASMRVVAVKLIKETANPKFRAHLLAEVPSLGGVSVDGGL